MGNGFLPLILVSELALDGGDCDGLQCDVVGGFCEVSVGILGFRGTAVPNLSLP